ncbi:metallophosphoesterase [Polynucleobacter sp. 39-46-10]|uniref:metallophosphoesterase n=1 Tax=Polynucleobacter sp. 39-46-10 TaxID=1970428 RepID=UPI00341F4E89
MRLHVLSDLHLEFADFYPIPVDSDVVVLAGDIATKSGGMAWARDAFPNQEIIYVAGNHEFYGTQRLEMLAKLYEQSAMYGIHFLDDGAVEIRGANDKKTTRFLGLLYGPTSACLGMH